MKVINNSEQELEILIELPGFIVWFMLGPIAGFGGLFTVALLLGGEVLNALTTGSILLTVVLAGRYFLTQSTRLLLDARENRIRMRRSTLINTREYEFPLEQLDSAEVLQSRNMGRDSGTQRSTSSLNLVFSNTQPATRVPVSNWSISGGGAGQLADTINDWLRTSREGHSSRETPPRR